MREKTEMSISIDEASMPDAAAAAPAIWHLIHYSFPLSR